MACAHIRVDIYFKNLGATLTFLGKTKHKKKTFLSFLYQKKLLFFSLPFLNFIAEK